MLADPNETGQTQAPADDASGPRLSGPSPLALDISRPKNLANG